MKFLRDIFETQVEATIAEDGAVEIGSLRFSPAEILRQLSDFESFYSEWRAESWLPEKLSLSKKILDHYDNARRFSDLCRAIDRQQVVPFVGSGMSVPSGFPAWANFLRQLLDRTQFDRKEFNSLIISGDFEEVAERLSREMPRKLFDEQFQGTFEAESPANIDGPVRMLPELFKAIVVTANYDNVVETIYLNNGISFEEVLSGADLEEFRRFKSQGRRCLLKIHGAHNRPRYRVLTKSEYDRAYAPSAPARKEFEMLFRNSSMLFLGCSLMADRTMQLLADIAKGDSSMPSHYAFLRAPAEDNIRLKREHFLAERHIFPIWYLDGHDESIEALLARLIDATTS
jgi:hypothetical protein